ncbi:MAP10 protein, partial [Piaya cayana]|nr:MAP10 protein [Piaya cayana]
AEGLFSLEVVVEAVRVSVAPDPALLPAVALRLLDFPTLLLRPANAPPLRPGQPFPFGRGKRCLFRCGVSLAHAAAELLRGPGPPGFCGQRGRFALRDPAGRPVGDLLLGYRLSSLRPAEQPAPHGPRGLTPPPASPEPEEVADEPEEEVEEKEGEELEEKEGEELEGNVFCPPVLYYSREPAEPCLPPAAMVGRRSEHVEAGRPQEPDKGQIPPRPIAGPSLLHPTSSQQLHNTLGQLPLLSALLAELSVFARSAAPAAVHPYQAWLYQALGTGGMASQLPCPSCSSVINPAEIPVGPGGSGGAASPQFKQDQQETTSLGSSWAGKGPKKVVPQGETISERHCTTKENRPPRRKLFYGLTNTLRLRLQQNNPDKLIIHERREQYRKKQMGMLKQRSPLSKKTPLRNAGEQDVVSCRHCSKGDTSKQNNHFDKNVETSLQSSVLTKYSSVMGDVSPNLQKQAVESLLKTDGIVSKGGLCKVTTAPLVDEPVLKSTNKENYVKAQLPAAFSRDANAKGNNEEVRDLIHHKTTEHDDASLSNNHKPSPSKSVENNSEFTYSDDFASPENTNYSEDFTSSECEGSDLEALDSSPEPPWPESPKQGCSDAELESSRSRISKTSQRAESTSDLLPVHSVSSPVQSLKRNHDLKNSKQSSVESVDSLNDASIQPRLLDEEQEAQQISKEENSGDQHVKQVSTLRSKQADSDTDVNIGKGQTSAGKSQSVTQVSSYLSSDMSGIEFSVPEDNMTDKEDDFLGKLCLPNQCKDISELVVNKLPGYTV